MQLWQYQKSAQGIPPVQAPERVTTDKWQPNTNLPQTNWQKAALYSVAAVMPFFTIAPQALTQPETPKVLAPQAVVVSYPRLTQYQGLTSPVAGFSPQERITLNKWFRETERPNWTKANDNRTNGYVALNPSPVVAPVQTVSTNSYYAIVNIKNLQYQGLSVPPKQTATETVTPDKWNHDTDRPVFEVRKTQHLAPAQAHNPAIPNTAIGVQPSQDVLVVFRDNTQYQALTSVPRVTTAAETVTVDKWFRQLELPTPDVKRLQLLYQNLALNISPIGTPAQFVSVAVHQATVPLFDVKRLQALFPAFTVPPQALTQPERSTPDKWQPETSKPLFDLKRQQYTYSSSFFHPEPQEVTQFESPSEFSRNVDSIADLKRIQYLHPSLSWNPATIGTPAPFDDVASYQTNVPYFPARQWQFLYPPFSTDANALTQKERSSVDKWFLELSRPRFDIARNQHLYPTFFFDPQWFPSPPTTTVSSFYQTPVPYLPAKHVRYAYLVTAQDSKALTIGERITLDKWFAETGRPQLVKAPGQFVFPSLNPFVREIVLLDKWNAPLTLPLRPQARLTPSDIPLIRVTPEVVTIDKWLRVTESPVRNALRLTLFDTAFIRVGPIEFITLDKWYQPLAVPTRWPVSFRQGYPTFILEPFPLPPHWEDEYSRRLTSTGDEYSQRGTGASNKYSSRGSAFGNEFSNRGTASGDEYSNRGTSSNDEYSTRGNNLNI